MIRAGVISLSALIAAPLLACAEVPTRQTSPTAATDPASIDVIPAEAAKDCKFIREISKKSTDEETFAESVEEAAADVCNEAAKVGNAVVLQVPDESNIPGCQTCAGVTGDAYQCPP